LKRVVNLLIAAIVSAILSVNFLAFLQARAMTRFAESGERTGRPEALGALEKIGVMLSGVHIVRLPNRRTPAELELPFTTHRYLNPSGSTLEAWHIPGSADLPMVALFHGYAANKSTLLSEASALYELGHSVLLVDFYGSGGSSGSGTTIGVREAEDVAATVDYIRRAWPKQKLVLYGISMGGAAVLRAVAVGSVSPDAIIIEATFDRLLNTGRNRFQSIGLPGSPFAELLLFWGSLQNGFNFFTHNPVDYARSVRCPTLILHGEKDQRVMLDEARSIAAAMGGMARLITYPEVPHRPIATARPDAWRRDVARFLAQLSSDSPS
jgi:pimeloyl-ACP methyl ester carboxylesterase